MADDRTKAGALQPRKYQEELFQDACRENVIAFLDTGAGKTLISVMLIKEKSRQLAAHLPFGAGRRITIFLAPQVALVFQQSSHIRDHLDLRVGAICGEMGVDWWDAGRWKRVLDEHDVLVSTPQVIVDALRHGFLNLAWVNLLCFDEAHHATGCHPYALLMKEFYYHLQPKDRPHIFGMTASPVNVGASQSLDRVPATISELEVTLNAKVMTVVDRSNVEAVAPPPSYIVKEYTMPAPSASIIAALGKLHAAQQGMLQAAAKATQDALLQEQRLWGLMGYSHQDEADVTRINSTSARTARHIANIAATLQELGPWCAAAALSAVLQPSVRNMYTSGEGRQQGADALGLPDAPPMGLADAWLLPADVALPQGGSLPKPDRQDSDAEQGAVMDAFRSVMLAVAELLVPAAAQHTELLTGLAEASSTRSQLRAGLARCMAAVSPDVLDAHALGTESRATASSQDTGADKLGGKTWGQDYRLVSPKVTALAQTLLLYKGVALAQQPSRQSWSCIVFATRKLATLAIEAVLRAVPSLGFLTCAPFMGYGGNASAASMPVKAQNAILERFKSGQLNCLVSTSVAEEGLDLKACQLVVRFDLPLTPLSFVQSKGRARVLRSHMVLMVQTGNIEHLQLLQSLRGYEDKMREEAVRRRLDRLQVADAVDAATAAADDPQEDIGSDDWLLAGQPREALEYCVPATGAKVTLASAKQLIFHFCARLPSDRYAALRPRFVTEAGFVCTVLLPNNSPLREVRGRLQMRRQLARASACLEACKLLHQAGALNDNLLPEAWEDELRSRKRAERPEHDSVDDEGLVQQQEKQAALPPFKLQQHAPAALQLCAPDALEQEVVHEDAAKHRPTVKKMHIYAILRCLAPGATAQATDDLELSQHLGLALLAPIPAVPSFTSQLSSGTDVQVKVKHLATVSLSMASVGRLQMFHRAMIHPDSLLGEAGGGSNMDAEDAAPAASTRRRIVRRQMAKAAATAVANSAAKLAAAACFEGIGPAGSSDGLPSTQSAAASQCADAEAVQAQMRSLPAAGSTGSTPCRPGPLLAVDVAAAQGDSTQRLDSIPLPPVPTDTAAMHKNPVLEAADIPAVGGTGRAQHVGAADQEPATYIALDGAGGPLDDTQGSTCMSPALSSTTSASQTPMMNSSTAASLPPAAAAWHVPAAGQAPCVSLSEASGKPLNCRPVSDARWAAPLTGAWYIVVPLTAAGKPQLQPSNAPQPDGRARGADGSEAQLSTGRIPCTAGLMLDWAAIDAVSRGYQVLTLLCSALLCSALLCLALLCSALLHSNHAGAAGCGLILLCRFGFVVVSVLHMKQTLPAELISTGQPPAAALEALRNMVLATRYNGWRYIADELHNTLTVSSPLPADRPRSDTAAQQGPSAKLRQADGHTAVPAGSCTFAEYYRDRWGEGQLAPQRLLVARHASRRAANAAADAGEADPDAKDTTVYLVPELCLVHPLPRSAYLAARGVPRLMWWLGGLLTAQELLAELGPEEPPPDRQPDAATVFQALTGTACQESFSYERLEMLGDAVLKFITCDRLFEMHPADHEGRLALRKDAVVSNVTLARIGQQLQLSQRLTTPFQAKLGPGAPGASPGATKRKEESSTGILRSKVLADVVEALTGAYYEAGGLPAATAWLTRIGVLPPSPPPPPARPSPPAEVQAPGRVATEVYLNYDFQNRALLAEALTHCSWPDPAVPCYQRLEFLGDAVLDVLVTRHLYHAHPGLEPGRLHDLRSASVNNERLAACAAVHRLHSPLRHFSQQLLAEIDAFLNGLRSAAGAHPAVQTVHVADTNEACSHPGSGDGTSATDGAGHHEQATSGGSSSQGVSGAGAAASALRRRLDAARQAAFAWATEATFGRSGCGAPKVLADIVESLTGAIFLDSNKDLDTVWQVVHPLLQPMVDPDTVPIHPVRELNERCQKLRLEAVYTTVQRHDDEQDDQQAEEGSSSEAIADSSAGLPTAGVQTTDHFEEVLRRRRGLMHGEEELAEGGGGPARHVKLTVSVAGQVLGRCRGALHKQSARMLAAQDALSKWSDFLTQLNAERAAAAMEAEERHAAVVAGAVELKHKLPLGQRTCGHALADGRRAGSKL